MEKRIGRILILLGLLIAVPLAAFGADLTIGTAITGIGNITMTSSTITATAFVGDGSGLTNLPIPATIPVGYTDGNLANACLGIDACRDHTSGNYNTGMGDAALMSNTTGVGNTAVGQNALVDNVVGSDNTAVGQSSLANNIADYNTAVGVLSLNANTTGYSNSAMGDSALLFNTTGNENTAVGVDALGSNVSGSLNTAIGAHADVNAINLTNATAIGANAKATASNSVMIGDVGSITPFRQAVTWIGGPTTWSSTSDIRAKEEIQDINYGLDFINALRPVQYKMKNGNGKTDFGFLAQDVQEILGADANIVSVMPDSLHMMALSYTGFIAPMVKAIQEQQQVIQQLRKELGELKATLAK